MVSEWNYSLQRPHDEKNFALMLFMLYDACQQCCAINCHQKL